MRSRAIGVLGVGLQVAGLTAAGYFWSQLAEIGGCGKGGRVGTIVYGPPCPAGTDVARAVMLVGLGLGILGAFLAAVGTSDAATGRVRSRTLWLAQLRLWCAAAVVWFAGKWFDPDPVAFRPGPEVIAVAVVALVAVNALAILLFGPDGLLRRGRAVRLPADPEVAAAPGRHVVWMLGLVLGAGGGFGAYALQRAVGPTGPLDAVSTRGEAVPAVGSFFEARNLRRAFDGLTRELGPNGGLSVLSVLDHSASASGVTTGGRRVSLEVDAAGVVHRSNTPPSGALGPTVPLARLRPDAIERIAREAERQSKRTLLGISLSASTGNWVAVVKEPGLKPFVANLDGTGVHRLEG